MMHSVLENHRENPVHTDADIRDACEGVSKIVS
jgi:hypothetical protein